MSFVCGEDMCISKIYHTTFVAFCQGFSTKRAVTFGKTEKVKKGIKKLISNKNQQMRQ